MGIVRGYEEDDIWPEFGTVLVVDAGSDTPSGPDGLLSRQGTTARVGPGWIDLSVGEGPFALRMDLHDSPPPPALDGWDDVVELPFTSTAGGAWTGQLTHPPFDERLRLAGPGDYRVRTHLRRPPLVEDEDADEEEGDLLIQFWPARPQPPRWLLRSRPAVTGGSPGWGRLLGSYADDLLWAVAAAADEDGLVTVDAIRRWGSAHERGDGWLDEPLPRASGNDPADVAARLGVAAPAVMGDLLALFVAARSLVAEEGGYRVPASAPSAPRAAGLPDARYEHDRYAGFAGDLRAILDQPGAPRTVAGLAEWGLADEGDVRDTLAWAGVELP